MKKPVTVYFATNRMPLMQKGDGRIIDFGPELGPIDGTSVRFGSVEAKVTQKETVVDMDTLFVAPEKLVGPEVKFGSRHIFEQIRADMKQGGRPTLVLVHGFSNTFQNAIERAAWIGAFYGIDANIFVFSWPSIGRNSSLPLPFANYVHDRRTAEASGTAVARTMRILYGFIDELDKEKTCRQPLHLICHSMGVNVLRHAVQALLKQPERWDDRSTTAEKRDAQDDLRQPSAMIGVPTNRDDSNRLRRTFEQVVLAAGDEDDDAFEDPRELQFLARLSHRVTVYHTPRDWILSTLSSVTKFNGPRLGVDGPDSMSKISDKVTSIDVSDVIDWTDDLQSHQYYRIFPAVRDDIVAVLHGERQETIQARAATSSQRYRIVAKP